MFTLFHGSMDWILAGVIAFIGIMVFIIKLLKGHVFAVVCSAIVWYFVFRIHSGSTAGIMTATFAALLFDSLGWPILKAVLGKK